MVELFTDYKEVDSKFAELRRLERIGDEMTHNVFTKLNQTFITPFDREDIHELASSLADILDFLNAAGARIIMYRITNRPRRHQSSRVLSCCKHRNFTVPCRFFKRTATS